MPTPNILKPVTVEELMARLTALEAEKSQQAIALAQAEATNKMLAEQLSKKQEITWGFAEFGKGAIVIRGFSRMPMSVYPSQVRPVFTGNHIDKLVAFSEATATINESRTRGFAYEFADSMYKTKHPDVDLVVFHNTNNSAAKLPAEWKGYYSQGLEMAKADPSLMSKQLAKRAAAGK